MLRALLLTLAVEVPLYTAALTVLGLASARKALVLGVVVNLVTHPALWLFLTRHPGALWPAEAVATAAEALILAIATGGNGDRGRGRLVVVAIALGANAGSLLIGLTVA
ncbi:hypothetical protein ACQP1P_46365 [Dactylosporangium sp. CA-052675]|uniref:hypothetical protein n=1 Tax=Dactylosporangium sp. CA-052675 TaxID=3239927 RepID=UPI003D902E37